LVDFEFRIHLHGADSSLPAKEIVCWKSQLSAQTRHNIVLVLDLNNPIFIRYESGKEKPNFFCCNEQLWNTCIQTFFGVLTI
jgi:hypothetical protein